VRQRRVENIKHFQLRERPRVERGGGGGTGRGRAELLNLHFHLTRARSAISALGLRRRGLFQPKPPRECGLNYSLSRIRGMRGVAEEAAGGGGGRGRVSSTRALAMREAERAL